jgi:hypothetical protein
MKRTAFVALVLCGLFFVATSSCFAQVIYGCVKSNGQLSIATGPGQCKNNETPISWNAAGPQGPQGAQGPQGPQGTQGLQGLPGVTAGIGAAVWGEYILDSSSPDNCSVPFFRGADSVVGTSTGNAGECRLAFTLPAGQPQSWGTAFACFTSIANGNGTPPDTTCKYEVDMDVINGFKPFPLFQCLNISGGAPTFAQISFVCIAQ